MTSHTANDVSDLHNDATSGTRRQCRNMM